MGAGGCEKIPRMTGYTIRAARAADLAHVQAIELAAATLFAGTGLLAGDDGAPYPLASLEAAQGAGRLWVAVTADDLPAGFALADESDGEAYLAEIDVHPDHGRRGLGRRLVEIVCDWARAAGYGSVILSTFRDVPWNAPFYETVGFRVLAPQELTPALHELRAQEAAHGLRLEVRVVMRRAL